MGRYNLLDEKWIAVIRADNGTTELVSMKELYAHAQDYYSLAGEMKTQDFAILRVLLAGLHTVFSRFDANGAPYEWLEIDEDRFTQKAPIEEDDIEDYQDALIDTWTHIWKAGRFPEIIQEYLERWRDHFNLFDEQFPFYQVTEKEMEELAGGGGQFFGKNLNRTISESNNKVALFSPIGDIYEKKDLLDYDQLVRWLITFQGYTGTGDKKKVRGTNATCSKGWLFDLGGVFLRGESLFETLWLNCQLPVIDQREGLQIQVPSWERSTIENVDIYFEGKVNNLASLYTNWSRAVSFNQNYRSGEAFSCMIAKLPEIDHVEKFLEPMTCWSMPVSGPMKDRFIPRKHRQEIALWRNFSVLMGLEQDGKANRKPGIIRWYNEVASVEKSVAHNRITICGISMKDDGNATSWSPTDEITDEINLETAVALDTDEDGWLIRINGIINETGGRINKILGNYLRLISQIRGYDPTDKTFSSKGKEEFYQRIDKQFRDWLGQIEVTDSKNEQSYRWYERLESLLLEYGAEWFREANARDMKGFVKDGKEINIAIAYNIFRQQVYREFHMEG